MASTLRYGCTAPGKKGATRRSRAESACSARTDSSCQLLTRLIAGTRWRCTSTGRANRCDGSVFVDGALAAHFGSAAPSLLLRGGTAGGERACLLPGRLREGANALVFLVLARDAGPPEQEEVAVVTLARAEVILAQ